LSPTELSFAISEGCLGCLPGNYETGFMLLLKLSQAASLTEQLVRSRQIDAINRNNLSKYKTISFEESVLK
jgi:hypothetical protein